MHYSCFVVQEKTSVLTGQTVIDRLEFGQFDDAEVEANLKEIEPVITKKKLVKDILEKKP